MALEYSFTRHIPAEALAPLFAQAGWTRDRTPEQIAQMIANTRVQIGVWNGNTLIGYARAVTDDLYRAYIEDVIVDEPRRGQGIGAEIMRQLLTRLDHVQELTLNCEDHLIPFYGQFGFERNDMAFMHIWKG